MDGQIEVKETLTRTIVKTLCWRVIAIVSTIILAVLLYNDLEKATKLGIIDNIIKLIFHFIFERIWSKILWGFKEVPVVVPVVEPAVELSIEEEEPEDR